MTRLQEVQEVARVALARQAALFDRMERLLWAMWVSTGVLVGAVAVEAGLAPWQVWWVGLGLWGVATSAGIWTRREMRDTGRLMATLEKEWEREEAP